MSSENNAAPNGASPPVGPSPIIDAPVTTSQINPAPAASAVAEQIVSPVIASKIDCSSAASAVAEQIVSPVRASHMDPASAASAVAEQIVPPVQAVSNPIDTGLQENTTVVESSTDTAAPTQPCATTPNDNKDDQARSTDQLLAQVIDNLQPDSNPNPLENLIKTSGRIIMLGLATPFIVFTNVQGSNKLLCESTEEEKKIEGVVARLFHSVTELPQIFLATVMNFNIAGTEAYRSAFGQQV